MRSLYITLIVVLAALGIGFYAYNVMIPSAVLKIANNSINGHLAGKVRVGFSSASITDLVLKDADNNTVGTAKKAVINYDSWKMLFRGAGIGALKSLKLDSPELFIIRGKDKQLNLASLSKPTGKPSSLPFLAALIEIKHGIVHYSDLTAKKKLTLDFFDVNAMAVSASPGAYKITGITSENKMKSGLWDINGYISFVSPAIDLTAKSRGSAVSPWVEYISSSDTLKYAGPDTPITIHVKGIAMELDQLAKFIYYQISTEIPKGTLTVVPANLKIEDSKASIFVDAENVAIENFGGRILGGDIKGRGDINLHISPSLNTDLNFTGINLSQVKANPFFRKNFRDVKRLEGRVRGHLNISGPLFDPKVNGDVEFGETLFNNFNFAGGSAELDFTKSLIELSSLTLRGYGYDLGLSGWYLPKSKSFLFDVKMNGVPPVELKDMSVGSGSYNFRVTGSASEPFAYGSASVNSLSLGGNYIGSGSADILYDRDTVYISRASLNKESGSVRGGGVYDLKTGKVDASFKASNYAYKNNSTAQTMLLSGDLSILGTSSSPVVIGAVSLPSAVLGSFSLNNINIPIAYSGNYAAFSATGSDKDGMSISASGGIDLASGMNTLVDFAVSGLSTARLGNTGMTPITVAATGRISGNNNMGYLWDAHLTGKDADIHSAGAVSMPSQKVVGYADINKLNLNPPSSGPFSLVDAKLRDGSLIFAGNLTSLNHYGFSTLINTKIAGVPFSYLQTDGNLSGTNVSLKSFSITGDKGAVRLSGNINPRTKEAALNTSAIIPDANYILSVLDLGSFTKESVRSMLPNNFLNDFEAVGRIDGRTFLKKNGPEFQATVAVEDGIYRYENLTVDSIISLTKRNVAFADAFIRLGSSVYTGSGMTGYTKKSPVALNIKATNGDIKRLLSLTPFSSFPVTKGKFTGEIAVGGTYEKPLVNGHVLINNAMLADQKIESMVADISTRNNVLYLDDFKIISGEGEIRGSGTVSEDGILDFTFSSGQLPLSIFEQLRPYIGDSSSQLNVIVRVTGKVSDPVVSASFETGNITLSGNSIDSVKALFSLRGSKLDITDLNVKRGEEEYTLSGRLDVKDFAVIPPALVGVTTGKNYFFHGLDIKGTVRNGEIPFLMSLAKLSEPSSFQGKLNADFSVSAKGNDSLTSLSAELIDASFGGVPITSAIMTLEKRNEFIDNILIDMATSIGTFKVNGELDGKEEDQILMESHNFDMAIIAPFFNIPAKFAPSGMGDLSGYIYGTLYKPNISLEATVSNLKVGDVELGNAAATFKSTGNNLLSFNIASEDSRQKLGLGGEIPFSISDKGFKVTNGVDIKSSIQAETFDLFSLFLPVNKGGTGNISGDLNITGEPAELSLDGNMVFRGGVVVPSKLKSPITALRGEIDLEGQKIFFKDIKGIMGQGEFTLLGTADFTGMKISNADIAFKGSDLAVQADYMSGLVSADAAFTVNGDNKALSGSANMKNALITIPSSAMAAMGGGTDENGNPIPRKEFSIKDYVNSYLYGTKLDASFTAGEDVWVTFMGSQVQPRGTIKASGVLENPDVSGIISLYKGTIAVPLFSSPFKINEGSLAFTGNGYIPNLSIAGESRLGDYSAHLLVSGPLTSPYINIDSDIPGTKSFAGGVLNENMIYSSSSRGSYNIATNSSAAGNLALQSILDFGLMRPMLNQIGRSLGLTEVSVGFNPGGSTNIKLAKALDKNERFLVTYEYGPSLAGLIETMWGVEYRMENGIIIRVASGSRGVTYVWVQYRKRF